MNPQTLNPKPLNPKPINPKHAPSNPKPVTISTKTQLRPVGRLERNSTGWQLSHPYIGLGSRVQKLYSLHCVLTQGLELGAGLWDA